MNDLINAAEKGLAEAEYQLGLAYSFGKGSTADDGKAWSWLNKAAHQNHQGAQSYLAWMSMLGLGKPEDKTQAIHWFILANQENTSTPNANDVIDELLSNPHSSSYHDRSADAEYLQGVELIESRFNEQDVKDGLTLLEKASDEKYAPAQFYLAKLYHEGHLVSKDLKMAAKLYTEAAYNGHPEAQYTLGWMYFYGEGVPQNQEEAFLWFSEANEHEKKATDAIQFLQSQRNVVELGNHPAKTSFKEKVRQASNYVKTLITRR